MRLRQTCIIRHSVSSTLMLRPSKHGNGEKAPSNGNASGTSVPRTLARAQMSAALVTFGLLAMGTPSWGQAPEVITLTQTGCQFVESENNVDHGFQPMKAADCKKINAENGSDRLTGAKPLTLSAGRYIFRVTNKNVPYGLGFWLRESDYSSANPLHKLTKTSVSGGGLSPGVTKDYLVELEAGKVYVYSCPLNPTPDYRLIVE